ncbi:MAG TPA: glucan biosynthesis protein G [Opitutaceae bacterium]|nr:glucan biosynthesis protein G [Opitutaceae bacterium]
MMFSRHSSLFRFILLLSIPLWGAARTRAADNAFDFESLRFRAKQLAEKPYVAPVSRVPKFLLDLSYDQHRDIRFDPNHSWWRREQLPFQLQFFHPGFIFSQTVQVNYLDGKNPVPIPFDPKLFSYGRNEISKRIPDTMGFAGFRIHYPLNNPQYWDELAVFLGASYFKALGKGARYGLSARGLALNTAEPGGEEFPAFLEFWVEKPAASSKQITVFALMDSASIAGAYRFIIIPGADTVMQIKATVYARNPVKVFGIAPLTSMFWYGENSGSSHGDFRPEVHDSDGLMIETGAGEWLWRPLTNPEQLRVASFADKNPLGFGLFQRDRNFSHYEDLEADYHLRPSTWIEPVGQWGQGSIRLVELPTADETNDNIVAFWVPEKPPGAGESLDFEYKLHWFTDHTNPRRPPAGSTLATHVSTVLKQPEIRRFVIDFEGQYLNNQRSDPAIEPVVSVGAGATLLPDTTTIQKNQYNGSWRVTFALKPDGSGHPVELRCFLRKQPHILTETWSYLWNP